MRVAVRVFGLGEQGSGRCEFLEDGEIGGSRFLGREIFDGFESRDADKIGRHLTVVEVTSVGSDGAVNLEAVFQAGEIVFGAMTGGGVDAAGAAIGGDVVGEDNRGRAVDERVAGGQAFEGLSENDEVRMTDDEGSVGNLSGVEDGREESLGNEDTFGAEVGDGVFNL